MSEQTKKAEEIEQEAKKSEVREEDLDNVAGGATNDVRGIDIIVRKKPGGPSSA